MLSDRIGAKVRGFQDAPPLSMAEKLLLAFCATALVFVCLAGYTQLDRQGKARAALTQIKAAQLAARAVSAQCYSAGTPFADQSTHDGFAEGIAGQIETLGALPGTVTLLQISEDGYTVEQLLYAEGDMRALYDAETGTVSVAILSGGPSSASALTDRRARDAAGGRSAGAHRVFAGGRTVQLYERRGLAAAPG